MSNADIYFWIRAYAAIIAQRQVRCNFWEMYLVTWLTPCNAALKKQTTWVSIFVMNQKETHKVF